LNRTAAFLKDSPFGCEADSLSSYEIIQSYVLLANKRFWSLKKWPIAIYKRYPGYLQPALPYPSWSGLEVTISLAGTGAFGKHLEPFRKLRGFTCNDDNEAVAEAKRLVGCQDVGFGSASSSLSAQVRKILDDVNSPAPRES
jgi:hypothetical protein